MAVLKSYNLAQTDEERTSIAALANECRKNGRNFNVEEAILKLPPSIKNNNFNATERVLSVKYSTEILAVASCKVIAMKVTSEKYPNNGYGGGINNEGDAFRHTLYSALIRANSSEVFANFWLDAHKFGAPSNMKKENYLATKMDLYNNDIGISIGRKNLDFNNIVRVVSNKVITGKTKKNSYDGKYLVPTNGNAKIVQG